MTVRREIAQSPSETGARRCKVGQRPTWEFRRGCAPFVGILQGGWPPCKSGRGRLQSLAREGERHTGNSTLTDRAASPPAWVRANRVQVRRHRACAVERPLQDRGAEHDGLGDSPGSFDDAGVGQLRLKFHDTRLDESLAFFGGTILRILAQIAMGTRFSNGFDIFGTLNFAKAIELCLERLVPLL